MIDLFSSFLGEGALVPTIIGILMTVLSLIFGAKFQLARKELKELGKELAEAILKTVNMPDKPTQEYLDEMKKEWMDVAKEAKELVDVFRKE